METSSNRLRFTSLTDILFLLVDTGWESLHCFIIEILFQVPMQYEEETNLCCCCIGRGLITMRGHVNKGAFVLGEIIQTQVYVNNMANESVSQLRVELRRVKFCSGNC